MARTHSGSRSGGVLSSILKRAHDMRAAFYPESTIGSESVCSDWDD